MLSNPLLDHEKDFQKAVAEAYKNEEYEATTIIEESLRTGVPVLGGVGLTMAYGVSSTHSMLDDMNSRLDFAHRGEFFSHGHATSNAAIVLKEFASAMLVASNVCYALSAPAEIVHYWKLYGQLEEKHALLTKEIESLITNNECAVKKGAAIEIEATLVSFTSDFQEAFEKLSTQTYELLECVQSYTDEVLPQRARGILEKSIRSQFELLKIAFEQATKRHVFSLAEITGKLKRAVHEASKAAYDNKKNGYIRAVLGGLGIALGTMALIASAPVIVPMSVPVAIISCSVGAVNLLMAGRNAQQASKFTAIKEKFETMQREVEESNKTVFDQQDALKELVHKVVDEFNDSFAIKERGQFEAEQRSITLNKHNETVAHIRALEMEYEKLKDEQQDKI